ncbi:unnamed protein product [Auanema sp. JU1783]|nr:unnamed protein product [Auanema sp. JU1783]
MEGTFNFCVFIVIGFFVIGVIVGVLVYYHLIVKNTNSIGVHEDLVPVLHPQELVVDALKHKCTEESDFYVLSF